MLEMLMGLLLAVVLAMLVFRATGASAHSFGRLQDELQLQEARRHILTQLEKIICYDAQRVIRLQENGQITCTMVDACKRVTIYSEKQGLYKKTSKNNGIGVNPVSLEGVGVTGWQLQPDSEPVTVTSESIYSSDGFIDYLKVTAAAANHAGAVQRLHRIRVSFGPQMQALAAKGVLAGRSLTGGEYLQQAALYTSIEEVRLPQMSFLRNKCPSVLNKKAVAEVGLSARFYYLKNNNSLLLGREGLHGPTMIVNPYSITTAKGSYYPDRLVLISENGNIKLSAGTRLAQALVLAKGMVTICEGCQLNGFVMADKIVIEGKADLTPDTGAVEPMLTPYFNYL